MQDYEKTIKELYKIGYPRNQAIELIKQYKESQKTIKLLAKHVFNK